LILWAVAYIDDVMYGGMKSKTTNLKRQVAEYMPITEIGKLDAHLGVHYLLKADKLGPYFECSMKKYVQAMCGEFEAHVSKNVCNYMAPAAPGRNQLKNEEETINMSGYRKFVGKRLFAVKKVLSPPNPGTTTRKQQPPTTTTTKTNTTKPTTLTQPPPTNAKEETTRTPRHRDSKRQHPQVLPKIPIRQLNARPRPTNTRQSATAQPATPHPGHTARQNLHTAQP
jgi:hypothetical protein